MCIMGFLLLLLALVSPFPSSTPSWAAVSYEESLKQLAEGVTEKTVKDAGLESRIALLAGDFNKDGLGGPYDVVLMSDILHYQTFESNEALVAKVFAHLAPGGRLIIKDRFLDEAGTGPAWTTAFAVHILVNTQQGECYKTAEAMRWMSTAGFSAVVELEKTAVVQGTKT